MSIIVRNAVCCDVEKLRVLAISSFKATYGDHNPDHIIQPYIDEAFSVERLSIEINDPLSIFLVSIDGESLVGYLKLRQSEPLECITVENSIEIERIYADPDRKGQGIGKALLKASADHAVGAGFNHLWLGVWSENPASIGFYESQGFKNVGEKTFMMANDPQVDYVMLKAL